VCTYYSDPPSYMDICELKVDMGEYCLKWVKHWYYDSALSKCRLFYYGGCYGNENRFKTEAECLFVCAGHVDTNTKQIPINAGATPKPVTDLKANTTQKATSVQGLLHCLVTFEYLKLELDRLHNYPIVPMPIVPIVRTADGEADCECYGLSTGMPCL